MTGPDPLPPLALPPPSAGGFAAAPGPAAGRAGGSDFGRLLMNAVGEVNAQADRADRMVERGLLGEDVTQAEVFTAVKKADLSLRMMIQVRNKLLEAWREVQQVRI